MVDKMLVYLAARGGRSSALADTAPTIAKDLYSALDAKQKRVSAMVALQTDPMKSSAAPVRSYDVTIEIKAEGENNTEKFVELLSDFHRKVEPLVHCDLSSVLVGENKIIIECSPAPIRYQYLIHRRHDYDHEQYLKHYYDAHSKFGLETGGILGYFQFHVNPAISHRACINAGLGIWCVDSVSELHVGSMDAFLSAAKAGNLGIRVVEDEEKFIDRVNSVKFVSNEALQLENH